jgi:hypothetical protein
MRETAMTDTIPAQEAAPAKSGLSFRGLYEIIISPARFFQELKDHPKVLIGILTILAASLVFFISIKDIVYALQMNSPRAQESLQGTQLTPGMVAFIKWQVVVFGTAAILLIPLIAAALAYFWGNFVYAGKATFKQLLSVMVYSEIIGAVGFLVALPFILMKGSMATPFNLGVLVVNHGLDSIAYVALSKIDIFNIWEIIVVGIGLAIVYNVPRSKGYVLSILSMGMLSILHVVFTAIAKMVS